MVGKVFVSVVEAKKLPKCDPYCIVAFDDGKEVGRTNVLDKDSNPVWDKKFTLELPEDYRKVTLNLTVMDKETMRKDLVVGTVSIPLASLREKEESNQWYPIVLKEKSKEQATLHVTLLVDSKDIAPIIVQDDLSKASKDDILKTLDEVKNQLLESKTENMELVQEINSLFGEMYYQFCHPRVLGNVTITIIAGRDLPKKDIFGGTAETLLSGTSDPYCKLYCGGRTAKSTVKKNNINPDWNETFTLPVMHGGEELQIDIFDEDLIGRDEFMGQVIVPLGHLLKSDNPQLQNTYSLRPKKFQSESSAKKVKGTLSLRVAYVPEKEVAEIEPTLVKRKSDLLEMASKVKANLLERIAESTLEVDKSRELVEEIETLFKPEFFIWCEPPKVGELTVKVLEAQGLAKKDVIGSSDPYVKLELDSQKFQTNVINNNLNPKWENQTFKFDIFNLGSTLHATVFDHDAVGSDNFIGKVYLPLVPIYNAAKGNSAQFWYLLGPEKGVSKEKAKVTGQVLLDFSYNEIIPPEGEAPKLGKDAVLAMVTKVKSKLVEIIKAKDAELETERKFQQAVADLFGKEYNELCAKDIPGGVQFSGGPAILEMLQSVKDAQQRQLEQRTAALNEANNALYSVTNAIGQLYTALCKPDPIATVDVTVVEARNLAKRDIIGSSDPYVTISIENLKEQTEVIHNNLNPKWNKSFNFTLTRPAAVFEVVMWDYDRVGASDHMGTVVISLEDLKEGPVDKWYPLGQKRGKDKDKEEITGDVHLIFKYRDLPKSEQKEEKKHGTQEILGMVEEIQKAIQEKLAQAEAELAQAHEFVTEIDSIFLKDYFTYCKPQKLADLVVHVVEARGLAKKDIIGSSDPYVIVELEGKEQRTETINNNLNPKWSNGKFSFELTRLSATLNFTLFDYDTTGSDDFLGYIALPITGGVTNVVEGTEAGKKKLDLWLPVGHRATDPADVSGELHLVVEFVPVSGSDEQPSKAVKETTEVIQMVKAVREAYHKQIETANEEAKQAKEFVSTVDALFTPEYYEWCKPPAIAQLNVLVKEARELIKADTFGSSDPFVVLEIENQKAQTVHLKNTINPKWDNQIFDLPITKLTGSLLVSVFDYDAVGANDPLGSGSVSIRDILSQTLEGQQPYEVALPLAWTDKKEKKPISGTVFLTINFRPIKADEIKKEGKAYQKEVEERATAVKEELVKRARESGAMFGKLLARIEKERPFATAPIPEGSLSISISGARGLIAADIISGTSDPYCIVRVGKIEHKTEVVKKTLEPVWNASFTIPVINAAHSNLEVTVMDHDLIGSDDFLGYVSMPISLFEEGHPNKGWFKLQSYKKYKGKGEIFMEVTYTTQNKENLLIDFEPEPVAQQADVPAIADPEAVVQALDEVFKAYEEKVKALEKALKGEKNEKERVSSAAQSLAAKLTAKIFVGK